MSEIPPINLRVDDPTPLRFGSFFGLELPGGMDAECFRIVREQIEFRRKCMHQGFDNLLELLALTEKALLPPPKNNGEMQS